MLNRLGAGLLADLRNERFTRVPLVAEHPDLDQLVAFQRGVDFADDLGLEACFADHDHGLEMVGAGAERAALGGIELFHWASAVRT